MGLISEFKEFALKGNMVDLAVGVVIGAAFGGVVGSLVKDVMMPPLGILTGGVDFSSQVIQIRKEVVDPADHTHVITPAVDLRYGSFLNSIINFLIVAVAIFIVIKLMNSAKRKPAPVAATPPPPTKDQELLGEIRDILKSK